VGSCPEEDPRPVRRTGSEEIGSSKALGRAGMIPGLPRLLLLVIFLVKLQSGGLGSQNTTMPGALCPASSSLLCFIGWSYPQIVLYSHFFLSLMRAGTAK